MPAGWKETEWEGSGEGGDTERGMNRESWERSAICFCSNNEDKNGSSAQKQNVSIESEWEMTLRMGWLGDCKER